MKKPSRAGKVAHDLGLSTWFGGTLFGQVSLNPAVSSISDEEERGRVLNEAWARFQTANFPAMLSTLLGWRLGGVRGDSETASVGVTEVASSRKSPSSEESSSPTGVPGEHDCPKQPTNLNSVAPGDGESQPGRDALWCGHKSSVALLTATRYLE
jgi:hypothetical protein